MADQDQLRVDYVLGPLWAAENRQLFDRAKPAVSPVAETRELSPFSQNPTTSPRATRFRIWTPTLVEQ